MAVLSGGGLEGEKLFTQTWQENYSGLAPV